MKRNIITTSDGSTTIQIEDWNEQYHSKHGAIQEAYHIFIKNGLSLFKGQSVSILEIGFGTGLNAFITFLEHRTLQQVVHYEGVEAYPITTSEALQMNYVQLLKAQEYQSIYNNMHTCQWNEVHLLSPTFSFKKRQEHFEQIADIQKYDLIYFDAFGARVQPELWTKEIFLKMYNALKNNGILVTYSSKGSVRRAMLEVGFQVQKLAGPLNKREMLQAIKL